MNDMLKGALKIIERINQASYEAYIVGGFTRDYLLGLESSDIDITTSATPDIIERLFPDHFNKSLKFRTITVRVDSYEYEITTYRTDQGYSDHRHPITKYAKSLEEDVIRRDFTINALCLDKDMKITDLVGGRTDLENGIIKAIGNPKKRFNEDALRMFRAFRFASRFNFIIEPKTYDAITGCASLTSYLSKERIRAELEKILCEKYFSNFIGNFIASGILDIYPKTVEALKILKANYKEVSVIELVILSSILSKDIVREIHITRKEERYLLEALRIFEQYKKRMISRYTLLELEDGIIESVLKIASILRVESYKEEEINNLLKDMTIKKTKDLDLTGTDIKEYFNLEDSPLIGEILDKALKLVVDFNIENKKEVLLESLKNEMKGRL